MNDHKTIFRQEAVQNLSVRDHLNERLNIVSMYSWIIICALGLIIIALIVYGFLGSIPTRIQGNGILLLLFQRGKDRLNL